MLSSYSPQNALEQQLVQQLQQRFATVHSLLLQLQETEREEEEQEGKEEHKKEEKVESTTCAQGEKHNQHGVHSSHEENATGMRTPSQASQRSERQEMDHHTPQKTEEKRNENPTKDEKKTRTRTEKGEVFCSETGAVHSLLDRIQEHLTVLEKHYEVYVWPPAVTFTLTPTSSSPSRMKHSSHDYSLSPTRRMPHHSMEREESTTSASMKPPTPHLPDQHSPSSSRSSSPSSRTERKGRDSARLSVGSHPSRSGTRSTHSSSSSRSRTSTPPSQLSRHPSGVHHHHLKDPSRHPFRWHVLPHPLDPSVNPSLCASSASFFHPPLLSRMEAPPGYPSPTTKAMHPGKSSLVHRHEWSGAAFGSGCTTPAQVAAYQRACYEQLTSPFVQVDSCPATTVPPTSASLSAAGASSFWSSSSRTGEGTTTSSPSSPPLLPRRLAKEGEQLPLSFQPLYLSGGVRIPFPHDIERSKRRWEEELSAVEELMEWHGAPLCDGVEKCERILQRCQRLFHSFASSSATATTTLAPPLSLPENRWGVPPLLRDKKCTTSAPSTSDTITTAPGARSRGAVEEEEEGKHANHEKFGSTDLSSTACSSSLQDAWAHALQEWVSYDPQYAITLDNTSSSSSSPSTESTQTNRHTSATHTTTSPPHRPHEERTEGTSGVPQTISEKERMVWERIATLSGNPLWDDTASPSSASRPLRPRRLEDAYYLCKENEERYRAMRQRWSSIKQDYMQAVSIANAYLSSITLQLDAIEEEKLMKKEEEEEKKKREEEEIRIVRKAM